MKEIWNKIKKAITNRKVWIPAVAVLVLFVVFYPHTNTTKVNSDFTGVYTVQKERYFLHNLAEFSVENVCTSGTVIKQTTTNYRLNGDIKSVEVTNCDGTYGVTKYNSNGTRKLIENTIFIGTSIQFSKIEYNKN